MSAPLNEPDQHSGWLSLPSTTGVTLVDDISTLLQLLVDLRKEAAVAKAEGIPLMVGLDAEWQPSTVQRKRRGQRICKDSTITKDVKRIAPLSEHVATRSDLDVSGAPKKSRRGRLRPWRKPGVHLEEGGISVVSFPDRELVDDEIEALLQMEVAPHCAAHGPTVVRVFALARNKLRTAEGLVRFCLEQQVHVENLRLFENCLGNEASTHLSQLVLRPGPPLQQLHLTHNNLGDDAVSVLLQAVVASGHYPWRQAGTGALVPLWLRLCRNCTSNLEALVPRIASETEGVLRVCYATSRTTHKNTPCPREACRWDFCSAACCDNVPHVHLPLMCESQNCETRSMVSCPTSTLGLEVLEAREIDSKCIVNDVHPHQGHELNADPEGGQETRVALLQLAVLSNIWVVDLLSPEFQTEHGKSSLADLFAMIFTPSFAANSDPLTDYGVLPVGFGIAEDLRRLGKDYPELFVHLPSTYQEGDRPSSKEVRCVELKDIAQQVWGVGRGVGLSCLCQRVLGSALDKQQQVSNWSARPLSKAQISYAALDAYANASVFAKSGANAVHCMCSVSISPSGFSDQALDHHAVASAAETLGLGQSSVIQISSRDIGIQAKTIAWILEPNDVCLITVLRSDAVVCAERLLEAVQKTFAAQCSNSRKLRLATPSQLVTIFGYSRGVLGPVGLRTPAFLLVDATLDGETIFCGAGHADYCLIVAAARLVDALNGSFADIVD